MKPNEPFTVTSISNANKHYRLYRNLLSRVRFLHFLNNIDDIGIANRMKIDNDIKTLQNQIEIIQLDTKYIIHHTNYKRVYNILKDMGTRREHAESIIGYYPHFTADPDTEPPLYTIYKKNLCEVGLSIRQSLLKDRLKYAISESSRDGWYIVFNTLTVAPYHYHIFKNNDTNWWQNYVRPITRDIMRAGYGSVRKCPEKDIHRYFAVVERGSKTQRLHIHVVHMMKYLPTKYQDPNRGRHTPDLIQIPGMRTAWPYGFSAPIPHRTGTDAFTTKGWRLPVARPGKPALKLGSDIKLANYLSKYIMKSYNDTYNTKGDIKWRTKMTRNLGINEIFNRINQIPMHIIRKRLIKVVKPLQMGYLGHKISTTLFNHLLQKSYIKRLLMNTRQNSTKWKYLMAIKQAPSLKQRYQLLIRKTPVYNLVSTIKSQMQNTMSTAIFDYIDKILNKYLLCLKTYDRMSLQLTTGIRSVNL